MQYRHLERVSDQLCCEGAKIYKKGNQGMEKNMKNTISIFSKIVLILVFLLTLYSCNNIFSNDIQEQSHSQTEITEISQPAENEKLTIIVTPVFDEQIKKNTRSAYPQFDILQLDNFSYIISSEKFKKVKGTYSVSTGKITFSNIESLSFTDEIITVYAVKKITGDVTDEALENAVKLWEASATISYALQDSISLSLTFVPYAASTEKGEINLIIQTSTEYTINCDIKNSQNESVVGGTKPVTIAGSGTNSCTIVTLNGVEAGTYTAAIEIKKDNVLIDYLIQTINVWPGIITDRWYLSDGTKNQEYNIAINKDEVKIYVKGHNPTGIYSTGNITITEDTETGTIMHPVHTLQAAVNKCKSSSIKYTIIVDGTVIGKTMIGGTSEIVSADSVTIEGMGGFDSNNEPKATLNGNEESSVITINSSFKILLRNIKITNGRDTGGGGIYISSSSDVTIEDGTFIEGNVATTVGGGIYNAGNLTIKGGDIKNNTTEANGSAIYNNGTVLMSGGIISANKITATDGSAVFVCQNKEFEFSGGSIQDNLCRGIYNKGKTTIKNTASIAGHHINGHGAAVYNDCNKEDITGSVAELVLDGGTISDNISISSNGGGIYNSFGEGLIPNTTENVKKYAKCTINNGIITDCHTNSFGGGICNAGIFKMTGGKITNCTTYAENIDDGQGGAIASFENLILGGDAYIPSGDDNKNDIFIWRNHTVELLSSLTKTAPVALLTAQDYVNGTDILSLATGATTSIEAEYEKFSLRPYGTKPWVINNLGKLHLPYAKIGSTEYDDKASLISALKSSSLAGEITVTLYCGVSTEDLGSSYSASNTDNGSILYALKLTNASAVNLIIDQNAGIVLPEDCSYMFSGSSKLKSADLRGFDTSAVKNMRNMFYICNNLESLNLSSFDTRNVENMQTMFYSNKLSSLDVTSFDTSNVTTMNQMFGMCSYLTSLDLSNFKTSSVLDMEQMFWYCSELTTIIAGDEFVVEQVTSSTNMFNSCSKLRGGKGTSLGTLTPKDKTYARIDGGILNPGYFTQKQISIENLANYILTMSKNGCIVLPPGSDTDTINDVKTSLKTLYTINPTIEVEIDLQQSGLVTLDSEAFKDCPNITAIYLPSGFNSIDTNAFYGCTKLKNVFVDGMSTDAWNNINFGNMFANPCCNGADLYLNGSKLETVEISSSFAKVKKYSFYGCTSITSIVLPSSINEIGDYAFAKCSNLTNLPDLSGVTTFGEGVLSQSGITSTQITLSQLNGVIPDQIFYMCNNLTEVEIASGFTAIQYQAFGYCNNLTKLTIPASVTSIEANQFIYSPKNIDIYYDGTQEQWDTIVNPNWNYGHSTLRKITVHFNDGSSNDTY